jgi:hypothetical protein
MSQLLDKLGFTEPAALPAAKELNPITEAAFEAQQVVDLSKSSLDFLAGISVPTVYEYPFPPAYLAVWDWLKEYVNKTRDFSQLALGIPRGFAKTFLMKLFILYCILFTQKRFILILCESEAKAINILSDVIDMLDEQNIKTVFGDWRVGKETDTQTLKKFGYRGRNIILLAAGAGTGIRGITLKNERPDVMLFDDIQSRECADSKVQSDALERWMIGTAMKAKSPRGCLFLFTANMYPTQYSLLRKLKQNSNWIKFITGGILADGSSLWEDLQPIAQLMREYANDLAAGHPEIFFAEVLNDETASANNLIDLGKLPPLPYAEGDIPAGNFIIIDPSTGKLGSDNVAIGYFEIYEGLPVLMELTNSRLSPGDSIETALRYALRYNCRLIAIESVAYQATLAYWFRFICEQKGIYGVEAVELYPGGTSKNSRILGMFKSLLSGEVFVAPKCRDEVFLQILQFNPLKRDNIDDVLDLLTYPNKVIEMYQEYIVSLNVFNAQDIDDIEILPAGLNSAF